MIRLIITFILVLFTINLNAQKKEINQAITFIKSSKDLDKAETLMNALLQKPENKNNEKIYLIEFDAIKKQYELNNEKLYLKQKTDTVAIFTLCKKMFTILEQLDSIDALPNKNGKIKIKYRKKHANVLDSYRPNLFYGGTYFIRHQQYNMGYDYFKTYIDCASAPLFSDMNYTKLDKKMPEAAYWAVFCGFKIQNPSIILKYKDLAIKDSIHNSYVIQYIAEAYLMNKDTINYVSTLKKGFNTNPIFPFFFPRLIDYYIDNNKINSATNLVDSALSVDPKNVIFRYAKSTILLDLGKFKESISICDSLISENDSMADAFFNAGTAYINMAIEIEDNHRSHYRKKEAINCYKNARKYLERYRILAPDEKDKWAPALYRIYLNLNMGKQFDEIDKIIRNS